MGMTIQLILCGRNLGTKKEPSIYGTCDNVSGHSGSCSSPELKAYRRNAVAKTRAKQKTEDDSLDNEKDEKCACGHTLSTCPKPKTCGLSRAQIEETQKRAEEAAAQEAHRVAANIRRAEEERYLADILNKVDVGETISHEDQALFLSTVISYLNLPAKFTLDRDTRIRRGLDIEARLSEVLYGPSYTGLYEPITKLDESSFPVRLARFLNVADIHGSLNTPRHPSMVKSKTPEVSLPPLGLPPVFHRIGAL